MSSETGFIHIVVQEEGSDNELLLLNYDSGGENNSPLIILESKNGDKREIDKEVFDKEFAFKPMIRISKSFTGGNKSLMPLSPAFISYKGLRVLLICFVMRGTQRYAVYQKHSNDINDRGIYAIPVTDFYNIFSLVTEVGVPVSPTKLDDTKAIGYIVNSGAKDQEKYPIFLVELDTTDKSFVVR